MISTNTSSSLREIRPHLAAWATVVSAAMLSLALGAGCGAGFAISTPENFVVLEDDERFDHRSTNAQGVVISVREIDNDPRGSLAFWLEAIQDRLRDREGYALLSTEDVRASTGQTGKQLRFGRDEGSQPYLYWLTVFVTDDTIFVVEAGGQKEPFEAAADQVTAAIASLEVR